MNVVIGPVLLLALVADVRGCVCDPAQAASMEQKVCSLTRVAVARTDPAQVFFIQDANPTKPNRWLAIPHPLHHQLNDLTADERTAFWTAAIAKARELWGDAWGVAVNSEEKRTQCQLHAHIGKLLDTADRSGGTLVERVDDIPVPAAGNGIWIEPAGAKLRVHVDEPAGELNLMR